jgi:Transketolase, N-terminal subunit
LRDIQELKEIARELRIDIITMVYNAQSGHPGGSLSAIDILTVLYFGGFLRYDPKNPWWEDRDRFILSKGHASPALYSVLAKAGYIPKEELSTYRKQRDLLRMDIVDCKVILHGKEINTAFPEQKLQQVP